jgi:hypothetical protein
MIAQSAKAGKPEACLWMPLAGQEPRNYLALTTSENPANVSIRAGPLLRAFLAR